MPLIKKLIFYITLLFIYTLIVEFSARTLIFYKTKNLNIYSFGIRENVKFEINDLSNFQFNIMGEKKIFKGNESLKKKSKKKMISIWTFGASKTQGYNCGEESSSWPEELRNTNDKFDIINFGFPGIYSDYSIKKLQYNISKDNLKKPDIIIWAHRDEEIQSILHGIKRNKEKIKSKSQTKKINPISHFLLRVNKTAENKLTFFKIMNHAFHKLNHTAYKMRNKYKPTKDDYKLAVENFKWNTLDAINLSNDHKVKQFIILSLFSVKQVQDKPLYGELLNEYFKIAASLDNDRNIKFIRSDKYASDVNKDNINNYFCENNHYNLKGNKLISKIVNNFILQE